MAVTVSGTGITFNDSTTQTTAFTGAGGVTSLNGQTGAITNTTVGNIGSVIFAGYGLTTSGNAGAGTTFSGANLYYASTIASGTAQNGGYTQFTNGGENTMMTGPTATYIRIRQTSGYVTPLGTTTLTGTWRAMTAIYNAAGVNSCCGYQSYTGQGLFVRVS